MMFGDLIGVRALKLDACQINRSLGADHRYGSAGHCAEGRRHAPYSPKVRPASSIFAGFCETTED
jgi:hypothetical protein